MILSRKKRTLRLVSVLFAGLLLSVPAVFSQTAGLFSRMGLGARGMALGNAGVADGFGQGHPYYNPALAPYVSEAQLEVAYSAMTFDRSIQFLQVSAPMQPNAGISGGVIRGGVRDIDGRDGSGFHTENYSTSEYAMFVAFGSRIGKRTSFGIRMSYYRADLLDDVEPVSNIGLSTGLLVRLGQNGRIGFSVDDLLARYAWNSTPVYQQNGKETTDRFPTRYRFGGAYRLPDADLTVLAEYESSVTDREGRVVENVFTDLPGQQLTETDYRIQTGQVKLGAEWQPDDVFSIRAGLEGLGTDALRPSAGFEIRQPLGELPLRFGYTFKLEPYSTGTLHVLSLQLGL